MARCTSDVNSPPHRYGHEFRRLQARARKAGLGLWADVKPSDLPHYYRYRRRRRASMAAPVSRSVRAAGSGITSRLAR